MQTLAYYKNMGVSLYWPCEVWSGSQQFLEVFWTWHSINGKFPQKSVSYQHFGVHLQFLIQWYRAAKIRLCLENTFLPVPGEIFKTNFVFSCMLRQPRCFGSDRCCFAQHQASSLLSCYFVCTQCLFLKLQKLQLDFYFFSLSLLYHLNLLHNLNSQMLSYLGSTVVRWGYLLKKFQAGCILR